LPRYPSGLSICVLKFQHKGNVMCTHT
jgi:hypothetical protein